MTEAEEELVDYPAIMYNVVGQDFARQFRPFTLQF